MQTIRAAFNTWKEEIAVNIDSKDYAAMAESWSNFTDALCKDGEICELQYKFCPSWDRVALDAAQGVWAKECIWVCEQLGVKMSLVGIPSRTDGTQSSWTASHNHAHVTISRSGKGAGKSFSCEYSWGTSRQRPTIEDVLSCVLRDAECGRDYDFDEFVDEFGYEMDTKEKRRHAQDIYRACQRAADNLNKLFSADELESLSAMLNEL